MGEVEYRGIEPGSTAFQRSLELRYRVMYAPFGLPREIARGIETPGAEHVGAFDGERLIGYARLVPGDRPGADARVYQVVVEPEWQQLGIGANLMYEVSVRALRIGASRLTLDARLPAVAFYERLGFVATGPEFLMPRTAMPHIPMARSL